VKREKDKMANNYKINNEMAEKANKHFQDMANRYKDEIAEQVHNTVEYRGGIRVHGNENLDASSMYIDVRPLDSVTAAFRLVYNDFYEWRVNNTRVAILNFASYKNPGGGFLRGSKTQEESLCHESTLYNVLKEFDSTYYSRNRRDVNKSLYYDAALYTPDVIFEHRMYGETIKNHFDVLTCSAPNLKGASTKNVSAKDNYTTLASRVAFIVSLLHERKIDAVILGAFGCGIFGQDPEIVAKLFKIELERLPIKTVIFAIPDYKGRNFKEFCKVFYEYSVQ
jgi:uncharacterized protein (TIGR02452 family)